MGVWGPKLYQDDLACDVRDEYIDFLKIGKNNEEITKYFIDEYSKNFIEEDKVIMIFSLADVQWDYGRLSSQIKKLAIRYIDEKKDLNRWISNTREYQIRKNELYKLKKKIESPMPPEKKLNKLRQIRPIFKKGDLLLHQICSDKLKDNKWYGKYVLIKIVGYDRFNIGSLPSKQYYNEYNVFCIYNIVSKNCNFIFDEKNLSFIDNEYDISVTSPKYKYLNEKDKRVAIVNFCDLNFKKHNYKYISSEVNYKVKDYFDEMYQIRNIPVYDFKHKSNVDNLDYEITLYLDRAFNKGELIIM